METDAMLWRRLDVAGHDACRLVERDDGWRLEGAAAFRHEGVPACLAYAVDCDREWRTRDGTVHGWLGGRPVDVRVARTPDGTWTRRPNRAQSGRLRRPGSGIHPGDQSSAVAARRAPGRARRERAG